MNFTAALLVTFLTFAFCVFLVAVAIHFGFIGVVALITGIGLVSCCFSETA